MFLGKVLYCGMKMHTGEVSGLSPYDLQYNYSTESRYCHNFKLY